MIKNKLDYLIEEILVSSYPQVCKDKYKNGEEQLLFRGVVDIRNWLK